MFETPEPDEGFFPTRASRLWLLPVAALVIIIGVFVPSGWWL